MARKYLTHLDLAQNELQNAVIQRLASAPSSPVEGQIYYNTTDDLVYVRDGAAWVSLGAGSAILDGDFSTNGLMARTAAGTYASRIITGTANRITVTNGDGQAGNPTLDVGSNVYVSGGTDVTVADGGTGRSTSTTAYGVIAAGTTATGAHQTIAPGTSGHFLKSAGASALAAFAAITQSDVTNLVSDLALKAPLASPTFTGTVTVPTPSGATDAANKGYVDNAIQGLSWKQAVRVATTTNGTLASAFANGQTVDGVTLATGDRILLKDQSTGSQNGIYTVNASGAPTRALDANSSAEIDSMTVYVESGTANADTTWTLTTDNPTLDTTALVYAQLSGGALPVATTTVQGKVELATTGETEAKTDTERAVTPSGLATFPRKYAADIGNGSATSIAVTHSLGSKDVVVSVRQNADDVAVECDVTHTSTTQVTLGFATAPATNALRVTVIG